LNFIPLPHGQGELRGARYTGGANTARKIFSATSSGTGSMIWGVDGDADRRHGHIAMITSTATSKTAAVASITSMAAAAAGAGE
jgi:hypothetical protein